MMTKWLLLGDNLEILQTLESESIDLTYLNPPLGSLPSSTW